MVTAAIHFEAEAYDVTHGKPMGRHFAGHSFLSAFARHSSENAPIGYVGNAKAGNQFCSFVKGFCPDRSPRYITTGKAGALREVGCLFTPSPINTAQTWQRELHGPRSWSLCGVNHTLSSARDRWTHQSPDGCGAALGRDHLHVGSIPSRYRDAFRAPGGTSIPAPGCHPLRQAATTGDSPWRGMRGSSWTDGTQERGTLISRYQLG